MYVSRTQLSVEILLPLASAGAFRRAGSNGEGPQVCRAGPHRADRYLFPRGASPSGWPGYQLGKQMPTTEWP